MTDFLQDDENYLQSDGIPTGTRTKLQRVQYQHTADLVIKGLFVHQITGDAARILDAVELGLLNRDNAARFAGRHLGYDAAYFVKNGRRMAVPNDPESVRSYWRKLPGRLLTAAERRLRDADCDRLRKLYPQGFETVREKTPLE